MLPVGIKRKIIPDTNFALLRTEHRTFYKEYKPFGLTNHSTSVRQQALTVGAHSIATNSCVSQVGLHYLPHIAPVIVATTLQPA
jgi:hypothetical protein